jgi:threonine dehydrogenase-like Zn-dependent dehydrogenase
MLAAVLKAFGDLRIEDVPVPEPGAGEVVIRVKACGFCATDYKAIKGIRRNVTFISHRFPLARLHEAVEVMAQPERNKVIVNP